MQEIEDTVTQKSNVINLCIIFICVYGFSLFIHSFHFLSSKEQIRLIKRVCHFPRHYVPALNKSYCLQIFPVIFPVIESNLNPFLFVLSFGTPLNNAAPFLPELPKDCYHNSQQCFLKHTQHISKCSF